jgi:tetratricopeptide (TPR) repeat protein
MAVANEYRVLSDNERAAAALERGLAIDPSHAEIRDTLRSLYESSQNWDKLAALIAGDADKADNPDDRVKLLRKAAQIHADKRKDSAAAAELLRQATEVKPEDRDLMLELCDAFSASGRGKEAVAVLEKIVESYGGKRSKELGEIHRRLARAYLADSETQKALEELDKAFRIEPGNVQVLKELGEVSVQVADYKKAQQMFRALLLQKLDKDSPITKAEVFMHLGDVHMRLGETQKAVQMLERAVQTDDSLERAKELLAQVKGPSSR